MSRTLTASRWGVGATLTGLLALALMALAAVGPAPRADAAFTSQKCAGDNIIGRGASFARDAHEVFTDHFRSAYCLGTPGENSINVTYEAQGSGAGRLSVKVRDGDPRFGMTDEPPSPNEVLQMNTGVGNGDPAGDSNPSDNGIIHVVPAAIGVVAPLVNFPGSPDPDADDYCNVNALPVDARTAEVTDPHPQGLARVRFTKEQFENIWAKEDGYETWVDVFPELETAGDGCDVPIVRVVRFDDSGTSFAFKDNLGTINASRNWLTTWGSVAPGRTRNWPGATFGSREDCPKVNDQFPDGPGSDTNPDGTPGASQLTSACFNGNQGIVSKMIETDGSVGYSDLSTARENPTSYAITPRATAVSEYDNDLYWTQIPSGPGNGEFEEPTADPNGFKTGGPRGSNCQAATFTNDGDPLPGTLEDWQKVTGVNSAGAYAVCTLTYGLVFDDSSDVWGGCASEESKARTVKDYWDSVLTDDSQDELFGKDYSPLTPELLAIARAGIAQIDWEKGGAGACAGAGGGGGGGGGSTPPPAADDSSTPPPPAVSNKFSLPRKTISSKKGDATVSVKVPGAGRVVLVGTAKNGKKTIKVGRVVLTANKAGTFKLKLKPSAAAKKVLRKKGKLKVILKVTFTPNGGSAGATTSTIVLKLQKQKRGKRK